MNLHTSPFSALLVEHMEVSIAVFQRVSANEGAIKPLWVNDHFKSSVGYSVEDLTSLGLNFIEPSIEGDPQERIMKRIHGFLPCRREMKIRTKTGSSFMAYIKTKPFNHPEQPGDYMMLTLEETAELSPTLDTSQWQEENQDKLDIKALKTNERFLRSAVAAANVGLWEWHVPSSQVIYSPEWFTMLGYGPEDYPSGFATFELLSHSEDTVDVLEKADRAFEGKFDEYESRFRMKCKDGSWKWVRAYGRVTERDASGKAIHIYGTHIDISAEVEREQALEAALKKAEEAREAKERFLAVMSHEIRTPLNGIMGMIDFVLGSDLSEKQSEYLEIAHLSSRNLLEILNDTLDYSKLDGGFTKVEAVLFDACEVVTGLTALFTAKAEEQGIDLITDIDASFPTQVVGDPTKFRQVAINLLGNAIKFTREGSVKLSMAYDTGDIGDTGDTGDKTAELGTIVLTVADTGVGIPDAAKDTIFDSFTQADDSTSRKFGGTGLGLSITKKLVDLLDGSISFTSEEGVGTDFIFKVPMKAVYSTPTAKREKGVFTPPTLTCHHAGVLIVEDHPINQKIIKKLVADLGLPITLAGDGLEAVERSKEQLFDLILMDIQMPNMDGVDATRHIRRPTNPNQKTPIMALTAHAIAGDKERYIGVGMNDYLPKPIDRPLFYEKVASLLGVHWSVDEQQQPSASDWNKESEINLPYPGAAMPVAEASNENPKQSLQEDALEDLLATL